MDTTKGPLTMRKKQKPTEGVSRCVDCGCKYWDQHPVEKNWRCHSCSREYVPAFDKVLTSNYK